MTSELSYSAIKQVQQSETAFKNVMHELLNQELNGPVPQSLLVYTGNVMDIRLILDMTDDEIDDLYYFAPEVDTSLPSNAEDDAKSSIKMIKRDLPKCYKRLVKVFTSFHKHLQEEGVEIFDVCII